MGEPHRCSQKKFPQIQDSLISSLNFLEVDRVITVVDSHTIFEPNDQPFHMSQTRFHQENRLNNGQDLPDELSMRMTMLKRALVRLSALLGLSLIHI